MKPEHTTIDSWFEPYPEARIQALCVALRMYKQQKEKEDEGQEGRQVGALEAYCMLEELAEMYPEHAAEAEITFIQKYQV
jgi:hypothetical protein